VIGAPLGSGQPLRAAACPASAIPGFEFHGSKYRPVRLLVPRGAPLAVVTISVQDQPCNDVVVQPPSPAPPPAPAPPPRLIEIPLSRLAGIDPSVAVGARDRSDLIYVSQVCTASSPAEVAVRCLGLPSRTPIPPFMTSSSGAFQLSFGSFTTCTFPEALPPQPPLFLPVFGVSCLHVDGFFGGLQLRRIAMARLGEVVTFTLPASAEAVLISYGRTPPAQLGSGPTVSWRIPASGTYNASLTVRSSTEQARTEATYALRLRVRRF